MSQTNWRARRPYPWVGGKEPAGIEPVKVIVCGTRTFDDYEFLQEKLDKALYWFGLVHLVIGGYGTKIERKGEWYWTGADAHANTYAEVNWITRKLFHPDWGKYGKAAGPRRNGQMAKYAAPKGFCVAFWDGKGSGTANMMKEFLALNPKKHLRLVRY